MIKALPQELSSIGDLIDIVPTDERNLEYLKNKINIKALQLNNSGYEGDTLNKSAFTTTRQRPTCNTCGKEGHLQKDCYRNTGRSRGHSNTRGRRGNQRGRGQMSNQNFQNQNIQNNQDQHDRRGG